MPKPPAQPPRLSRPLDPLHPHPNDPRETVRHWNALIDAGLIGTPAPADPHVTQSVLAADALFRRIAQDRRR